MKKYTQNELNDILNCIRDGVFITDGSGNILLLNETSAEFCRYSQEELIGQNVNDLIRKGYFDENEVVSLKCIETGCEESMIQKGNSDDHEVMVTGVPHLTDGKADLVVVTERDVSHIKNLERELHESKQLVEKYRTELKRYENEHARDIIYCSKEMENTITLSDRVAKKDITVLIQGESGTGKAVVANYIHKSGNRCNAPFIKVNCGAIPENLLESELFGYEKGAFTGASERGKQGLFELADKGALFLDEIGIMSLPLQGKILRVLQNREIMHVGGNEYIPIDVRIIAATNTNLKSAVEAGEFRLDLYYRLNVVPIVIPPLRTRKSDIYPLAKHFLQIYNNKFDANVSIDKNGWNALRKYNWPGNVRELENIIERLVIMYDGSEISASQITEQFDHFDINAVSDGIAGGSLQECIESYEKNIILSQMEHYKRSGELAEALGINKSTLNRKIKKYGITKIYGD